MSEEAMEENDLNFRTLRSRGSVKKAMTEDMADIANIRQEIVNLLETVSFDRMDIVFSYAKSWARQSDQWEMIFNEMMELVRDLACFGQGALNQKFAIVTLPTN